jgi:spore coat protein CotF
MDDKNLMEDILMLEKGVCDLYMHGTIESATDNVHKAFSDALNESLCMQDDIYDKMASKGWYPTETADASKVEKVKQKFNNIQMQ